MVKQSTIEKISRGLLASIKVGIFLTLFLPVFMHSNFFFPFIVPKNILFRISVEVILILYICLAYINPKYRPSFSSKILWAVSGFGLIALITSFTGIGVYRSFWGNYERMAGMFHLLHLIGYFFVLFNVLKQEKEWYPFFSFSIFVSMLMCMVGFSQWIGADLLLKSSGGSRITGTIGNAAFVAAYLIFSIFFLIYFLIHQKNFNIKTFGISILGINFFLIFSAILSKAFSESDWGMLNSLKMPLLLEATKIVEYTWQTTLVYWFYAPFMILGLFLWWLHYKNQAYRQLFSIITPARIYLALILALHLFILWHTQTRGALLALYLGSIVGAGLVIWRNQQQIYRLIASVVLAVLLISPVVLVLSKDSNFVNSNDTLRRLATISLTDTTTESRLTTWQASFGGWVKEPRLLFLGTGLENYYYVFNKNFPIEIYKDAGSQVWFDRAHNIILDVGVTTGIFGLLVYLSVLLLAGYRAVIHGLKSDNNQIIGWLLAILLGVYFIQNLFVFDTLNTEIPFYFVLAFIVFLSYQNQSSEEESKKTNDWFWGNIIYPTIAVLLLVITLIGVNIQTARANNFIFKAFKVQPSQSSPFVKEREEYFRRAIALANTGRFEARDQLSNYIFEVIQYPNFVTPAVIQSIDFTVDQLKNNVAEEPLNIRHHLVLANMFNGFSLYNKPELLNQAIKTLEDAIWLSPSRPQVYFELGRSYALKGEIEKATEVFLTGVNLSPKIIDARLNLMNFYISTGQLAEAEKEEDTVKQLGWKPTEAEYLRLINSHVRVKNYQKAIQMYQTILTTRGLAEYYAQMAMIYARMGEKELARQSVAEAVKRAPALEPEVKVFLERLEKGELVDQDFVNNK
jgi:tetratricopeptide (TPR) repeat protein